MTAPEPRANPSLFGHQAAEATLANSLRSGRMHHAWLLTGPAGVGKATLAFRFARRLLAGVPRAPSLFLDPGEPVFRRVAAGSHADLCTVERAWDERRKRYRSEIVVDAVRAASEFLRLTPAEGGWRVVVVDGAENLNRNAANALLKILEEPPSRAVLLLTCAAPGRLLPTVRSRCRRLALLPLAPAPMADALAAFRPDLPQGERDRLAAIADGSPGRALLLAEEEGLRLAQLVDDVLTGLPAARRDNPYEIADALGRSDTAFGTFMELLRAGVAAAVGEAARGRGDPARKGLIAMRGLDAWGEVWQGLSRLQDETERFNLDKRQAVLSSLALLSGSLQSPL